MSAPWVLPEELRQLAETDEGLVKEVLSVFQSDTAERIANLQAALQRNDLTAVKSEAHALKGSAGQVGAGEIFALARQIEHLAAGRETTDLPDLAGRLETEFENVCREMSA